MFSRAIIRTDMFLDMPPTAQNLYFHLGMEADDDGFTSPKMVMRLLGSQQDDLKVLITKGFVIPFKSGVIVIKHWRENNYLRSDRHKPTIYQEEFKLACKDKVYLGIPMVDQRLTQYSIVEDSIDKDNTSEYSNSVNKSLKKYER